ncbi:putative cyclin-dependent kinase 8 [Tritrichomonas foetus]|uniref:Cyclin-dependent kinase 8 n=1 Tax=Tritrichomonas foetus TaxID=1144522 RepID=A0A1J4JZJ4_9EUKA|nr:putative cyclin-dependent kinase 8 [Tritrichomonas foetus]|eukprot:OHT02677.1 putative cyclin-dependent kinase 8 [Tritrichomonas foetus]
MNQQKNTTSYSRISDRFHLIERYAATSISSLWRGTRADDEKKEIITVKCSKLFLDEHTIPQAVFRELIFLSEINSPHIIKPIVGEISCDLDESNPMIAYCFENHLADVRRIVRYFSMKNALVPPVATKSIIFQLLLALDYLHTRNIAHCNVISANVVIMPQSERIPGIVKLVDLGYSRVVDDKDQPKSLNVVHPWYRAPELMLGDPNYDQAVDMWACGCILGELLTGTILFGSNNSKKENNHDFNGLSIAQLLRIVGILGPISESDCKNPQYCTNLQTLIQRQPPTATNTLSKLTADSPPEAAELLSRMLVYNPTKRITAREALKHAYFSKGPVCVNNIAALFSKEEWKGIMQPPQKPPSQT